MCFMRRNSLYNIETVDECVPEELWSPSWHLQSRWLARDHVSSFFFLVCVEFRYGEDRESKRWLFLHLQILDTWMIIWELGEMTKATPLFWRDQKRKQPDSLFTCKVSITVTLICYVYKHFYQQMIQSRISLNWCHVACHSHSLVHVSNYQCIEWSRKCII